VAAAVTESVKAQSPVVATVEEVVAEKKAGEVADEKKTADLLRKRVAAIKSGLDELSLPVGWPEGGKLLCREGDEPCDRRLVKASPGGFGRDFGGWLFTAIAIALGAPFWFDLLNKLINLRAAAPPPEKVRPKPRAASAEPLGSPARDSARPGDSMRPVPTRSDAPPPPPLS
jgi:hypothetical protein